MSKSEQKKELLDYLETKVNIIVKPLMHDILISKTDDVVDYIIQWCNTKGRELELKRKEESGEKENSYLPESDQSEEEENEGEDEDEAENNVEIQKKLQERKTKKKNAISAEAYGEYNKMKDFEPRIIEKSAEEKQLIKAILLKNFMFKSLEEKNQEIVINAMDIKKYKKDDYVIKQGDDGEELFIVSSGTLKCTKIFPGKTEETFLKTYISGEVFGELSLMYNAPRAASIIANEDSVLFSLDRDTFNHIVKNATIQQREKYNGFLKKIDILSTLDNYEREKICDCLETRIYNQGEYVIKEGESGDEFYLIQEGTADALKEIEGKTIKVFDYKENDYFGELALLSGDKRKASIIVTSDKLAVAFISQDSFKRLLGPIEDILKRNISKYEKYIVKA
jgi:cAMP-dependent protein kinase regulator